MGPAHRLNPTLFYRGTLYGFRVLYIKIWMGDDTLVIPNFQNGPLLRIACWVDGVGMAWDINSYPSAQWVMTHVPKTRFIQCLTHKDCNKYTYICGWVQLEGGPRNIVHGL